MDVLLQLDGNILLWIQEHVRNAVLTPVMTFITHLGDAGWIWIALAIVFLLVKKMRRTGVLMTCSLLGSLIVNNLILKNLVARTRPYEAVDGLQRIIEAQRDLSFPSGHTGSSDLSDMPREDRGAGFDPGISDHVFKTLCRSALSDGRSCRNDHGDTDRSAGMQGVSEKHRKVLES